MHCLLKTAQIQALPDQRDQLDLRVQPGKQEPMELTASMGLPS
jgi:hypothetical protein